MKSWNAGRVKYWNDDQRTIPLLQHSTTLFDNSSLPPRESLSAGQSGNHAALEHFISDGTRYAVEKLSTHLRILPEHFQRFLLYHFPFPRLWLAFFRDQILARRVLIFLDDSIGQLVHYRVLLRAGDANLKQ
jgi:hypothetical protein